MTEAAEANTSATPLAIDLLPVGLLDESPTNPRRHFDEAALAELAVDVERHGILQPALVREMPSRGRRRFEVVLGHRRLRAAKAVKLEVLPCVVRELTDEQAFALQLGELHKHLDVHYLDEAEAYARSRDTFGHSVEEIAAQVGKSARLVYQRLQLLHLRPGAREAALAEGWNASIAQAVATVANPEEQERLVKALRKGQGGDSMFAGDKEATTYRGVLNLLRHDFRLALKGAPWKLEDAELVPAAGPCTTCPKRTGNQPELFDEPKDRADVCTDPPCFRGKRDAVWAQRVAAAEETGQTVLSPAQAKKLFEKFYTGAVGLRRESGYVDVDRERHLGDDRYRSPRAALRKKLPPTSLVRDPNGEIYELVRETELNTALRAAGLGKKKPSATRTKSPSTTARQRRRAAIVRFRAIVASRLRWRAADAAEHDAGDDAQLWRFIARSLLHNAGDEDSIRAIAERRGLAPGTLKRSSYATRRDAGEGLKRLLLTATASAARGIAVELALGESIAYAAPKTPYGEWLPLAAKVFAIDVEQIEADVAGYLVAVAGPEKVAAAKRRPKARAKGKGGRRGKPKGIGKPRRARPQPQDENAAGGEASA